MITGGSVKYTVPSNYAEGRHGAEVTLNFTFEEGDGEIDAAAAARARFLALGLASGTLQQQENAAPKGWSRKATEQSVPAASQSVAPATTVAATVVPTGVAMGALTQPASTVAAPPSVVTEASPGPLAPAPVGATTAPTVGEQAPAASASTPLTIAGGPTAQTVAPAAGTATAAANGATDLSDTGLAAACNRAVQKMKGKGLPEPAVPVRAVVTEFVGAPPAGVRQIPAERRAEFLARLEAL